MSFYYRRKLRKIGKALLEASEKIELYRADVLTKEALNEQLELVEQVRAASKNRTTEITHVEPGKFFVDEQRIGPYRIWHHEHHFRQIDAARIEVTDRITYVLPLSPLGDLVHPFLVRPQLTKIFAYREKAVNALFA